MLYTIYLHVISYHNYCIIITTTTTIIIAVIIIIIDDYVYMSRYLAYKLTESTTKTKNRNKMLKIVNITSKNEIYNCIIKNVQ